jgi:hypothetical protein
MSARTRIQRMNIPIIVLACLIMLVAVWIWKSA